MNVDRVFLRLSYFFQLSSMDSGCRPLTCRRGVGFSLLVHLWWGISIRPCWLSQLCRPEAHQLNYRLILWRGGYLAMDGCFSWALKQFVTMRMTRVCDTVPNMFCQVCRKFVSEPEMSCSGKKDEESCAAFEALPNVSELSMQRSSMIQRRAMWDPQETFFDFLHL